VTVGFVKASDLAKFKTLDCKTTDEFKAEFGQAEGGLEKETDILIFHSIARGGVFLSSFLKPGSRKPPPQPTEADFEKHPEIVAFKSERATLLSIIKEGSTSDASKAAEQAADEASLKMAMINTAKKSKLSELVNAANEEWEAANNEWREHMLLSLALRMLGQNEAQKFFREVRGDCIIWYLMCRYMTFFYCINSLRSGRQRRPGRQQRRPTGRQRRPGRQQRRPGRQQRRPKQQRWP
jgi:hypothetical protein